MRYDYLIIGGGIAGGTAAETIREEDPEATIAIVSEEPHPLYSRVMLPGYLKRKIRREQLFLRSEYQFTQKGIDLRLAQEVSFICANLIRFLFASSYVSTLAPLKTLSSQLFAAVLYLL